MISDLGKENMLYNALVSKTSDKEFMISFHDYFSFITGEGIKLCVHLGDSIKERTEDMERLDELYTEILTSVQESVTSLDMFLKKEKLEDDHILEDRMRDLQSLINNTTHVFGGERLDSIYSEMSDITSRLYELGFEKELCKYVALDDNSKPIVRDIIALKNLQQFITGKNNFIKKDARSPAGVLVRLENLYVNIDKAENTTENKINIETFIDDLHKKSKNTEYAKLMSGTISEGSFFKKDKYISDIERFHQFIVIHNSEADSKEKTGTIFSIQDGNIYHYKIGKLNYKKKGLDDPKYIKMFKNIITYMPVGKNKIRIKELESMISNNDQVGDTYRVNVGKNAKSFNSFLKKNGVQNVHPSLKEEIISATDEYITFHNIL